MKTSINVCVVLLCLATLASCALLEGMFGTAAAAVVINDPAVQEFAGGVIENVIRGNWIGALYNLGELAIAGTVAVKATNIMRDRRRKKLGEPTTVKVAG